MLNLMQLACTRPVQVTVLSDATASASDEVQQANLADIRNVSIGTPTTAEWAAQLHATAAGT